LKAAEKGNLVVSIVLDGLVVVTEYPSQDGLKCSLLLFSESAKTAFFVLFTKRVFNAVTCDLL